ncbi:hypothetical protein [Candidatus Nanohalobium constans]|uniref:Uncharacterized protein n=1 Tax=Candidatus Nanohalobium constans TaxID=2565781 RepID=A0A5Q0UHC4_9ARCH|nr:hypothetical protein [Candidatus Nanohalobium constans]QGA81027.1 hypothetical protein LC1Nh_1161 [Candidatus Nanohalobium constans]
MVLQTVTPVIREIVSHSWVFASIITKYYLAGVLLFLYTEGKFSRDQIKGKILEDSRVVVSSFVIIGTVLYTADLQPEPFLKLFSQAIALGYLGYLFWEY